jgi:RNA polymerase sigma-70 factor (ECF subfamily)
MFRSIDSFEYRGSGSLKAWITRIAVTESLKHLKRNQYLKTVSEDFEIADEQNDEDPKLEEISQDMIMTMIRSLPDGYRTVFNLLFLRRKAIKKLQKCWELQKILPPRSFTEQKQCLPRK